MSLNSKFSNLLFYYGFFLAMKQIQPYLQASLHHIYNLFFLTYQIFLFHYHRLSSKQEIESDASNLALALWQTQDPVIQNLSTVTKKHIKRKDLIFRTFWGYFGSDSTLSELKDKQIDPEDPGFLVSKFIIYTRGPKNKVKYSILNSALICFVQGHKMSKVASRVAVAYAYEYQFTTWDTMLKTTFSYFGEHGV